MLVKFYLMLVLVLMLLCSCLAMLEPIRALNRTLFYFSYHFHCTTNIIMLGKNGLNTASQHIPAGPTGPRPTRLDDYESMIDGGCNVRRFLQPSSLLLLFRAAVQTGLLSRSTRIVLGQLLCSFGTNSLSLPRSYTIGMRFIPVLLLLATTIRRYCP
jgi:hypothetical protein